MHTILPPRVVTEDIAGMVVTEVSADSPKTRVLVNGESFLGPGLGREYTTLDTPRKLELGDRLTIDGGGCMILRCREA